MNKKGLLFIALFSVTVLLIVGVILWKIDYFQICLKGFEYYDAATEKYTYTKTVDANVYSFIIDLDNPKSNEGKVVYNKDGCKIYIESLIKGDGGENNYVLWLKS